MRPLQSLPPGPTRHWPGSFVSDPPAPRNRFWDVLQKLYVDRGCTVILVTHDLREAVYLADTVYVMSARPGRVILTRSIDLPRPRNLDDMYGRDVVELVKDLRHHIHVARTDQ